MAQRVYLAVDLGASGGRVLAGLLEGGRIRLEEIHRFENGVVEAAGNLHWDLLRLWQEIVAGLAKAATQFQGQIASVGVDTWGVDFGLLARDDVLLGNPYAYRDPRTNGILEQAFQTVPRQEIFAETGLQFMQFNSLYQLLAMKLEGSPLLDAAESLLLMPDLFHWLLTGEKANEVTNATTTQFYNPVKRGWATGLLHRFGLPTHLLGALVEPGTRLGGLRASIAAETGLAGVDVVVPGTHDTASAVMAVPAASKPGDPLDWCYISSGTWSLMGVETASPVVNDDCLRLNFTNEGGVGGRTRLLKNITGLWLVQECRRVWNGQGRAYDWNDLTRMADASPPHVALIDPDDSSFQAPGDMPEAIREFCRRTGQSIPSDDGAIIRCAVESLALKCRMVLEWLEELTGAKLATVHIVGGGTQNRQLCQATADACRRPVIAGPVEATALGNVMVQAMAGGEVGSIEEARKVIADSFAVERYEPQDSSAWEEAYGRFRSVVAK